MNSINLDDKRIGACGGVGGRYGTCEGGAFDCLRKISMEVSI